MLRQTNKLIDFKHIGIIPKGTSMCGALLDLQRTRTINIQGDLHKYRVVEITPQGLFITSIYLSTLNYPFDSYVDLNNLHLIYKKFQSLTMENDLVDICHIGDMSILSNNVPR